MALPDHITVGARAAGLHSSRMAQYWLAMKDWCEQLEATWHRDIPISAHMGVRIEAFDGDELTVCASLAPNINVHGTAFAGSLYSVCALTGWGMAWLQLKRLDLSAQIVLAKAEIDYVRAVSENFRCRCRFHAETHADKLTRLGYARKSEIAFDCEIAGGDGNSVAFRGLYALRSGG